MGGFFFGSMRSMFHVMSEKITLAEQILVRLPISVLAGWVTAALILNISIFLSIDVLPQRSEGWAIVISWVATIIYNLVLFIKLDPIYASVWFWAVAAVLSRNEDRDMPSLKKNGIIILALNGCTVAGVTAYILKKNYFNKD